MDALYLFASYVAGQKMLTERDSAFPDSFFYRLPPEKAQATINMANKLGIYTRPSSEHPGWMRASVATSGLQGQESVLHAALVGAFTPFSPKHAFSEKEQEVRKNLTQVIDAAQAAITAAFQIPGAGEYAAADKGDVSRALKQLTEVNAYLAKAKRQLGA